MAVDTDNAPKCVCGAFQGNLRFGKRFIDTFRLITHELFILGARQIIDVTEKTAINEQSKKASNLFVAGHANERKKNSSSEKWHSNATWKRMCLCWFILTFRRFFHFNIITNRIFFSSLFFWYFSICFFFLLVFYNLFSRRMQKWFKLIH